MSGPGSYAAFPSGVFSCQRSAPAPAQADEYLGTDGDGCDYYARGGQVYALDTAGGHTRGRGRVAAFNRINRSRAKPGAVAA